MALRDVTTDDGTAICRPSSTLSSKPPSRFDLISTRRALRHIMATIYDVAKRAHVSPSTVSRVFNNTARISEGTRARVLQAAQELDYHPSALASGLARKKSLMIGLVIPDIQNPYSATLARGVQDMVFSQGYVPIICNTNGDPEKELHVLREIRRRGVDGLIITPPQLQVVSEVNRYIRKLLDKGMPIVFVGNRLNDPNVDFVTSRAQDGAIQAVNYLVSLGHRAIGFIGGYYTQGIAVGRWLGYQEALIANRIPIRPEWMIEADLSQEGGEQALYRLLDLPNPPTAVFAINDLMAIGAITACRKRGVRVPEQMSIVGFDDIPFAALTTPPLTTVAQPTYELGHKAAELLLRRFQQPDLPPQQVILQCTLVIRQTTAPPSAQPSTEAGSDPLKALG